ncbi:type I-E CRISPR-associated protein Cse2/CasB [uncultured Sphingomonas sp.]|uniref:type I-E CRISPR-associated protein Cse2/CasB n=1 Tax=uncultured Sphingomonas sp. TaxID=158754 RepID=UPI00260D59CA|nr:type I-E CRISPR-associated protein Cse2/CasB [uncultured Sphingomonas sp.]
MASNPAASADTKDPVASIAGQIVYLSTGDRAQLRRIYLTGRHEADGVVIRLLHRADVTVPHRPEAFRPWRLLAHCAALLSGTPAAQAHATGKRLGTALHTIGLSENRLLRLTAVRGDALDAQVIRAVRMLAQHGERPVNLWTLFDLVGNDEMRAEAARLRIAQDYYAAKARSDKGDDE